MVDTNNTVRERGAFTLIELIVVVAIILAIAALAAAFAPRVNDDTKLSRAVDTVEQALLTAKVRAKRDQLATGIRFISVPGDPAGTFSQLQYIQQPDPLSGGWLSTGVSSPSSIPAPPPNAANLFINGSMLLPTPNPPATIPSPFLYPCPQTLNSPITAVTAGQVQIYNFDPTLGGTPSPSQWLVQQGDFLEINDRGVYFISSVSSVASTTTSNPPSPWTLPWPTSTNPVPVTTLQLAGTAYDTSLNITTATTNFRILRQPRLLVGESPVALPDNFAVNNNVIPQTIIPGNTTTTWSNVQPGPSTNLEILFSPSGAVVGSNAGNGKVLITVFDVTMNSFDINKVGIVGVQSRSGFIAAYGAAPGAGSNGYDPFGYAESGRESGL